MSPLFHCQKFIMIKENFIRSLVEQHIAGTDKFIVNIKVKHGNSILIFIDADSAVSIDDCAKLSRFVESNLNHDNGNFDLEVSSAGLDSPLVIERQYKKNIGKEIKVILKDGAVKKGFLSGIIDEGFEIAERIFIKKENKKKEEVEKILFFTFDQVKETRLVINI